jgi:A/G-specific adenine glycosylase
MEIAEFRKIIWDFYKKNKRDLPWRHTRDPYKILVSEVMLQQTQSYRVIAKYTSFIKKFPTVAILAKASVQAVLKEWQGLGYNRRALYLKKCAEQIVSEFQGKFPKDLELLCTLPGVGKATAGDILAFAWNKPAIVVETNIRSVFIHFFFQDKTTVSDKEIIPLIEKTLDQKNPREWYWALFDYGAELKKNLINPSRKSKHYTRQSIFVGSFRQKRGAILKLLLQKPGTQKEIKEVLEYDSGEIAKILLALEKEGFIKKDKNRFQVIV